MATIGGSGAVTLMDLSRRMGANDNIDAITELLHEQSEVLQDMRFIEGNLLTGNRSTVRTGLPTVTWRKINKGVAQSKSVTQQITDACGMLEGFSRIDEDLIDLANNARDYRASEDVAFLESMKQEFAQTLFYGDTDLDPEEFMGFSPRYDTPSASRTNSGFNLIDGGGSGSDNASIWFVVWGSLTVHGIVPKGIPAGFKQIDDGLITVDDAVGNPMKVYQTQYKWKTGLTIRDWRYVVRICNIDVSNLTKNAASGADLLNLMVQAVELPPSLSLGTPVFYASPTVRSFLRRQEKNANNLALPLDEAAGRPFLTFDGFPVRRTDQLLETEATIAGTFAHDDS